MDLKGSQTEKNLKAAFSGESMARNKYTFFAEMAKKEDLPEVHALFDGMARNESVHARLLFQLLTEGKGIGSSMANLKDAMNGEYGEWSSMYPEFAKVAKEEGFSEISETFEKIANIERDHEHRFLKALTDLSIKVRNQSQSAPTKTEPAAVETGTIPGYRCMFCGAIYEKRPDVCDVCKAIGSFENTMITKHV